MALTIREAVDTLPESSSKLWVSLFMVSTLMSGLPSVTPRRPGKQTAGVNTAGHTLLNTKTQPFCSGEVELFSLNKNCVKDRNLDEDKTKVSTLTAFALPIEDKDENQQEDD